MLKNTFSITFLQQQRLYRNTIFFHSKHFFRGFSSFCNTHIFLCCCYAESLHLSGYWGSHLHHPPRLKKKKLSKLAATHLFKHSESSRVPGQGTALWPIHNLSYSTAHHQTDRPLLCWTTWQWSGFIFRIDRGWERKEREREWTVERGRLENKNRASFTAVIHRHPAQAAMSKCSASQDEVRVRGACIRTAFWVPHTNTFHARFSKRFF